MNYLLLAMIGVFIWIDHYMPKKEKKIITICVIISFLLNLNDVVWDMLVQRGDPYYPEFTKLSSCIGYSSRPILLYGMWELLRGEKKAAIRSIFRFLILVNIVVYIVGYFTEWTVTIDPVTHAWGRGPLCFTSHYMLGIMILLFIPTLFTMYQSRKKSDFLASLFSLIAVLISVYVDTEYNKDSLNTIIVFISLLYFLFLHREMELEYTKALLVSQKAEMMMMQIKPHFINNTLGTIQALCEIDPALAAHTTGNFAKYLRTNLNTLSKPLPILITEELEHTKTYLEIEQIRFPGIQVDYDIQDTDFSVPPLSIQPLAENAIQHGLRKKKKGKLKISTRKTEKGHIVQIVDNGTGFDENNILTKEGHGVGMKNVRFRIETVCKGSMKIDSNPDEGTTVTIFIPD